MTDPITRLVGLIERWSGIRLDLETARRTLPPLIASRSAALGLSPEAYLARVELPEEKQALIDAVTVNYTWFYRDPEQMRQLLELIRAAPHETVLEAWVAGCSTGEDAYTLAMLALSAGRRVNVLGTDINASNVEAARQGLYGSWALRALEPSLWRYFEPSGSCYRVTDEVRRTVRFEVGNLLESHPVPPGGAWHLIVCRNVLIYFAPERVRDVRSQMARGLAPGGWLVQGASEAILELPAGFEFETLGSRLALRRTGGAVLPVPPPPTPPPLPPVSPPVSAPVEPPPSGLLAGAMLIQTDPQRGLALVEAVREHDPLSVEAHFCAGLALFLLDDPAGARRALRAALVLDPELWPAAFYAGLALESLGHPDEARREFERVLATGTQAVPALVQRALGDFEAWRADVLALALRRSRR